MGDLELTLLLGAHTEPDVDADVAVFVAFQREAAAACPSSIDLSCAGWQQGWWRIVEAYERVRARWHREIKGLESQMALLGKGHASRLLAERRNTLLGYCHTVAGIGESVWVEHTQARLKAAMKKPFAKLRGRAREDAEAEIQNLLSNDRAYEVAGEIPIRKLLRIIARDHRPKAKTRVGRHR